MAVMSAIHPTTYAPLCVEVGEFLPLYVKCLVNVTVDDDGDVHCVEQEGFCDIGDIECRRLLRFAYNYDIVGIYGIYRKYGSFVGIQLDATGLGKIKL